MRLVKPLLGAALFLSILVNIVLIYKVRGRRAIITINGAPITRTDMNNYLEQAYGPQYNAAVFAMTPGSVRVEASAELAQLGAKKIIIRMDDIVPGRVADLSDPKTLKKIKLHVQLHRAKPASELLAAVWQKANLVFDDQTDRTNTELLFFPDKSKAK